MVKNLVFVLGLFILLAILIVPLSQACITLNTYKTEFLPGETMQVEINVDYGKSLSRSIYSSDISLYNSQGNPIQGSFFVLKISDSRYFAWFDVPNQGDYKLKVRAMCGTSYYSEANFNVNKLKSIYYDSLKNTVSGNWDHLNLEEQEISTAALSFDDKLTEESLTMYFSRKDSCINTNCSSKNAALGIISFRDYSTRSQLKNLLDAYQNSFKGNWKIEYNASESSDCTLRYDNTSRGISLFPGISTFDLDFSDVNSSGTTISDDCNPISRKLIFSYKNFARNYSIANNFEIKGIGCWGNNLKNNCDPESTAYSLLALKMAGFEINNQEEAVAWLDENAENIDEIAIIYLFTKDESKLNQILSSQTYSGAWQKKGVNDIKSSVIIYYVLNQVQNKTNNVFEAINKAENYLEKSLDTSNLAEKSYLLYFVFPNIEPVMSIWPGVVKVKSLESFDLILQNKGTEDINAQVTFLNSTSQVSILKNSMKSLKINVPKVETIDARAISEPMTINYHNTLPNSGLRSYNLPVIIFTIKGTGSLYGNYTINQSQINDTGGIINSTLNNPNINQSADLNESLINENFFFNPNSINKTFLTSDTVRFSVELENQLPNSITDLVFEKSAGITNLVIEPSSIDELKAGETKTISFYADPKDFGTRVDGTVTARGNYNNQDVSAVLEVYFVSNIPSQTLKTCAEMNGKKCSQDQACKNDNSTRASDTNSCCLSSCETPGTPAGGKVVAIIIIVVVILILVGVLLYLRRKPKKDMKDFIDEVSKDRQPGYDSDFSDFQSPRNEKAQSREFKQEFGDENFSDANLP